MTRREPSRALRRSTRRSRSAACSLRGHRLGDEHAEPGEIEAEAGIERVGELVEPLAEQRANAGGIADGARGRNRAPAHHAVGAEQDELDPPRALAAAFQHGFEARREFFDDAEHVLLARDRLGKALLGRIGRNRRARLQGLGLPAERAVELEQKLRAEPRGERRARQIDEIADAFQADAGERRNQVARQTQRRN